MTLEDGHACGTDPSTECWRTALGKNFEHMLEAPGPGTLEAETEAFEPYARHAIPFAVNHPNGVCAMLHPVLRKCVANGLPVWSDRCVRPQSLLPHISTLAKDHAYIVILRDPRSIILSALKQCGDIDLSMYHTKCDYEEDDVDMASLNNIILTSDAFRDIVVWTSFRYHWFKNVIAKIAPVLLLVYEEMKDHPQREVKRISSFLGLDQLDSVYADVSNALSSKRLHKNGENAQESSNLREGSKNAFVRDFNDTVLAHCNKLMSRHLHPDLLSKWVATSTSKFEIQ
jgi:hypothetical protein